MEENMVTDSVVGSGLAHPVCGSCEKGGEMIKGPGIRLGVIFLGCVYC